MVSSCLAPFVFWEILPFLPEAIKVVYIFLLKHKNKNHAVVHGGYLWGAA